MGSAPRAAVAKAVSTATLVPTATASAARRTSNGAVLLSSISAGKARRTSTKTTSVTVSTRNWVRARSGAPCSAKITPQP